MKDEHLKKIREACIKANPEIEKAQEVPCHCHNDPKCIDAPKRPIRLADVLLAINKKDIRVAVRGDGLFIIARLEGDIRVWDGEGVFYDLRKDSLEEQSDETLAFIASLL